MSGMFGRLSDIVKAKMNRAMDEAEDPGDAMDLSYEQQLQMLQKVRRGIAEVATARVRLLSQLTQQQEQLAKLDAQARQALSLQREDLARTALTRKATAASQVQVLMGQVEDLEMQQNRLLDGEARLAAKIEAFRTHKETIKAQYTAAQAQVHIQEAVSGLSEEMGSVQLAMLRAQDKTERMQARATALDELVSSGALPEIGVGGGDDLEQQLAALSAGDDIERQLEAMKRSLPAAEGPRQLSSGPTTEGQYH